MSGPGTGWAEEGGAWGDHEDPRDEDDYDTDNTCDYCEGTGGDKWCDNILPCPKCGGSGRLE